MLGTPAIKVEVLRMSRWKIERKERQREKKKIENGDQRKKHHCGDVLKNVLDLVSL